MVPDPDVVYTLGSKSTRCLSSQALHKQLTQFHFHQSILFNATEHQRVNRVPLTAATDKNESPEGIVPPLLHCHCLGRQTTQLQSPRLPSDVLCCSGTSRQGRKGRAAREGRTHRAAWCSRHHTIRPHDHPRTDKRGGLERH